MEPNRRLRLGPHLEPSARGVALRIGVPVVVAIASFGVAATAQERPAARLEYRVAPDAIRHCPLEEDLRNRVIVRLAAYDPFRDDAPSRIRVAIERRRSQRGPVFHAAVEQYTSEGELQFAVEDDNESCNELVHVVVRAITPRLRPPPPPAPPAPAPPVAPPPPAVAAPPRVDTAPARPPVPTAAPPARPVPDRALHPEVYVATTAPIAMFPAVLPGFALGGGGRYGRFFVGLEAQVVLPSSIALGPDDAIDVDAQFGSVVPCVRPAFLMVCGLLSVGRLGVHRRVAEDPRQSWVFAYAGARVGAEVALAAWLRLRAQVDVVVPVARHSISDEAHPPDAPVWRTPSLAVVPGLAAVILP